MANKYLVGSGAFTSTSIWSNTYNGSGGASIPVSGDIIHVDANRNITSGLPNSSSFDFIVYLGANTSNGVTLGLSGSPTFRSLIIQSKNSAAHTVKLEPHYGSITVKHLYLVGSSTANRLTLDGTGRVPGGVAPIDFVSDGSSDGNFVNMQSVGVQTANGVEAHIGPDSVMTSGSWGWLLSSGNQPPTTVLNTPANATTLTTTTPTLAFTATDPEGDQVSYQVQVGNADFTTLHMDVTTATYASGTQQTRVVSPALTKGGIDYYWRVRAKDPSGSDSYGAWATARKMTTEALPPSVTSGATTAITTTTATAAGEVTSANGATITERGIAYHTSTNPTTANSKQVVSGTTGSFSGNLTGLTPNTTYYWRAYAT
ncbi:MAG: hypothetical protein EOL92_09105, partial [Bacteroidia bacterium]|nr:hypothetical protein [Bacteroidia bacterium]